MQLPGLIDPHVHIREPGATHKEDWDTGTAAALAGGFTTILAMPNTSPAVVDGSVLDSTLESAAAKARCDYGQYLGAGPGNASSLVQWAHKSAGLKIYLDQTYGPLRLDEMTTWMEHFKNWPKGLPIVAHAEGRTMAAVILLASFFDRRLHIAHVSRREEIIIIRAAKERGLRVTCEVAPHHLFLTQEDIPGIVLGRGEVRPRLAEAADRDALWENLDVIDCFATDHAPHTLEEKDGDAPPPGFPGLETALPLLSTAVFEGRITWEQVMMRMTANPCMIFGLPEQKETWIEFDAEREYEIRASNLHTRCRWTPFEGWKVRGQLKSVVLRGDQVYRDGEVLAAPGCGRNVRR